MIRLGIVDFDTSHVVQFTMRLNHVGIEEEQWVYRAKIVAGCPGTSAILEQEKVNAYAKQLADFGVEIVERPEALPGKVDGVLIESVDGSVHLERAKPFLEAGVPCYVDKPFTCSLAEAKELASLAEARGLPIFSSSSLRYGLEIQEFAAKAEETGRVLGAEAFSPAPSHPRNPGLFHYGIHGLETLYALMGPGCKSLTCTSTDGGEVATGLWEDGRIGVLRGIREGAGGYGFTAYCEKGIVSSTVNTAYIYRELLKQIVALFETGKSPLDIAVTVEIVAFIEAAMTSAKAGGARADLAV